ncbi:MAG: lysophospholipid acyltransferase family protein [Pseudomonadota bacterium]
MSDRPSSFSIALRSILFHLCVALITPPYAVFACLLFPLPHQLRYKLITGWTRLIIFFARTLCGIRFNIKGTEHLPSQPCILALKHSSAWETFAAQLIFPPQVWVLKRELLWIPFFGWGLWQLQPIAINRSSGAKAMRQMIQQANDRIKKGLWIVVFPEGTRSLPGERIEYKSGAAHLARSLNIPLVPVAHNAGYLWPKNDWRRYPGEITIEIGTPLLPDHFQNAKVHTQHLEEWIEGTVHQLGNPRL